MDMNRFNSLNFRYIPENDGRSNDILYIYIYIYFIYTCIYIYSMYYAKSAKCHDIRRGVTPWHPIHLFLNDITPPRSWRRIARRILQGRSPWRLSTSSRSWPWWSSACTLGLRWWKLQVRRQKQGEKDGDGKRCKVTGDFCWGVLWKMAEIDENDDIPMKNSDVP